ncbi:MAG: VWA domain-containing protein [Cyclobacteriaceae bacterium]|nr:VWA domain-containing protein [Cyclobacteriaceae bacterium]
MKQLIFESPSVFVILCLATGLGYAWLLYTSHHPWGKRMNWILFGFRALLVFFLTFFLLGPIIKQIQNVIEKPVFVILQDNSLSIKETVDSTSRMTLASHLKSIQTSLQDAGYETQLTNFSGEDGVDENFSAQATNINESLRAISNRFEGKSLAGTVFVSDGIYNAGLSPVYGNYNFPVYTIGIGDTTPRADLMIRNILYNKIAYQGNKFPIRVEVFVKGFPGENISVSLQHKGNVVEPKNQLVQADGVLTFEFQPLAAEAGIQRWDIQVEPKESERNTKNNRATIFIEVVEGRKKILVVAAAPHPDIKALRTVVEQNSNFEFLLHVPGVEETPSANLQPENIDVAIFHQVPDNRGRAREVFQRFAKSRTSLFLILGASSELNQISQQQLPLSYEQPPRQFDEVTPVINPSFTNFNVSTEANSIFSGFPPVQVHFGKAVFPPDAAVLLSQRVGSLVTEKPLLFVHTEESRKVGVMLGEGLWRWRLHEFSKTEKTEAFDELMGKLIQFLSTADDKRKFRSYTTQQQFSDTESVVFESQVYNDIYEPIYGNTIELEVTDEQGKKNQYNYVLSPGNSRYAIDGLKEGVYRYRSSTVINNQKEEVRGQFMIAAQQLELQNLTADFDLLRRLAQATGGKFYKTDQTEQLKRELTQKEAKSIIRSEERYDSLINLKWIFFVLLLLIGAEWFLRKYFGGY